MALVLYLHDLCSPVILTSLNLNFGKQFNKLSNSLESRNPIAGVNSLMSSVALGKFRNLSEPVSSSVKSEIMLPKELSESCCVGEIK